MKFKQKNTLTKSLLSLAITATFATSFMATANEKDEESVEVYTVTANRSSMSIGDALANQIVITRADIEIMNPTSVLDIFTTVTSVDVASNGGRGQSSSIFMRGTNSDHVLVLIDGIRISSATSGGASLNTLSPEMIERIEIVQGPRAALWGSDAIGGVIQIFTRQFEAGEFFAGASFGSDSYQKYKAGAGISHGDGHSSISISKETSDGFDVQEGSETDDDGYDFTSVAIRGQQKISKDLTFDWLLSSDQGDNEYDGYYNGSDIRNHVWLVRANYQSVLNGVKNFTTFSVGQNRDSADSLSDGIWQSTFETRRMQYSLTNNMQFSDELQINVGVDHYQDDVSKGTTTYDIQKRDTTGVFAHTLYTDNAWTYEATIRHDDVENIDAENTYNLGLGYQLDADSRLVANYGTGFKVPNFNSLYYPGYGTPTLKAEYSNTFEVFYETTFNNIDASINFYNSKIDDLIGRKEGKAASFAKVEIKGVELAANYQGLGGTHDMNVSYTDTEDQSSTYQSGDRMGELTYAQLIRRAKEKFNYKFTTSAAGADLYLQYQFVGARTDSVYGVEGPVHLPAFQLVNLGLNYEVTSNLSVTSRVTNLFDKDYQTAKGYNTQERAFYIGLNYQNF
ncbi:TonB-dependent receptor domain-containing protein [Thalassotalea profundi]|uniref:TonB-dependent receptor n=1 Tax=Thalassotalea profundi TaxID=2036687 RepID=A0ABQ3IPS6_9GAMM|nr:TonB-dependent receptor [Thalassotalea profundi]GHE88999.1 TonB-dependent receptor [Thalassotalea profundi]